MMTHIRKTIFKKSQAETRRTELGGFEDVYMAHSPSAS